MHTAVQQQEQWKEGDGSDGVVVVGGTKAQMLNYGCGGGRERDSSAAFTPQIAERESSSAWIKWHSPLKGWVAAMNRGYLPRLG